MNRIFIILLVRKYLPQLSENIEEYLKNNPEMCKKIGNILYVVMVTILLINIFICLPYMLFSQYCSNSCTWNFSKFNYFLEIPTIVLCLILFFELFIYKINFGISSGKKYNNIILKGYKKLSRVIDFLGKTMPFYVFMSLLLYLILILSVNIFNEGMDRCYANIKEAPEILWDTREKKLFRKNQTTEYTNEISNNFLNRWSPPEVDKETSTHVVIRISNDGKVLKYEVEKSSGNEKFDESVINIVKSAEINKPLPESLKKEYIDFMFAFTIFKGNKYVKEYPALCKSCQNPYKEDSHFY